jgi:hypothetical protein
MIVGIPVIITPVNIKYHFLGCGDFEGHLQLRGTYNLTKYIKMHIDDGLELLDEEYYQNSKVDGFEFLADKIEVGLVYLA